MYKTKLIWLVTLIVLSIQVYGQTIRSSKVEMDPLQQAQAYLTGTKGKAYNPKKALEIYLKLSAEGNPQATNALGVFYSKGIAVEPNAEQALKYFLQAANKGYTAALTNAAKMYDEGYGTTQDFGRAYKLYDLAAQKNDVEAKFYVAYYNYKGLGTSQDYYKAYKIFSELAEKGKAISMYYTALCLRNGYGTNRDEKAATALLQKAADKGDFQAKLEQSVKAPENPVTPIVLPIQSTVYSTFKNSNSNYDRIQHNANAQFLSGSYDGYAIRYDWSGKHIIGYWPLHLTLSNSNQNSSQFEGTWNDGESTMPLRAALTPQGLVFDGTAYTKADHYTPVATKKEFKNAQLQLIAQNDGTYIIGNLQLFVPTRNEPEKPIVIYLKNSTKNILPSIPLVVSVYPNPVQDVVNIKFTLPATAQTQLVITNALGNTLQTEEAGTLLSGTYQRSISVAHLPAGVYNIQIKTARANGIIQFVKQ